MGKLVKWNILTGPGGEILASERPAKVDGVPTGEPADFARDRFGPDKRFGYERYTRDDIWDGDGSFNSDFGQVYKVRDEKPRIGYDKITDGGSLVSKTDSEVIAFDKEIEANRQEASIDSNVAADMNYRELWEQWKVRTSKSTAYREWLRSKLRGVEP